MHKMKLKKRWRIGNKDSDKKQRKKKKKRRHVTEKEKKKFKNIKIVKKMNYLPISSKERKRISKVSNSPKGTAEPTVSI
jgi:hypothetical protein